MGCEFLTGLFPLGSGACTDAVASCKHQHAAEEGKKIHVAKHLVPEKKRTVCFLRQQ
jgi:hypothetical protein